MIEETHLWPNIPNTLNMSEICPVCSNQRYACFSATLLQKYQVDYFYCDRYGLLQTETPYWLEEAYQSAIAAADTGLVSRNISISRILARILFFLFDRQGKYLDIAGGYGMLTRLMRDIGFDFYWSDLYCENLLAKGFEYENASKPFTAITAFEVLEHIWEPFDFIKTSLQEAETSTIVFSTELFSGEPPSPDTWSYYALNTGQHISFYQQKTLKVLAQSLSLNFYSHGNIHMFSDRSISNYLFSFLVSRISSVLFEYVESNLQSKTLVDFKKLIN